MEGKKKQRSIIGIITAQAGNAEQKQIIKGIAQQAQEYDADALILSNLYNASRFEPNIVTENEIYELMHSEKISGVVLAPIVFEPELKGHVFGQLEQRKELPVVVAGRTVEDMLCVNMDISVDFEHLTEHLLKVHGFTNIDVLTGPEDQGTSHERVEGCRRAMERYGISLTAEHVFYGNFWITSGEDYAKKYCSGELPLPEAIICTNEYMAFGMCDTLIANGLRIPEDVTIVGYEHIGDRIYHTPMLTTYRRNRHAIGAAACRLLLGKVTQEEICARQQEELRGELIFGTSCSCGILREQLASDLQELRNEQFYSTMNLWGLFEQHLTECRSIEEYIQVLGSFCYLIRNIGRMFLCLKEDWCSQNSTSELMLCYPVYGCDNMDPDPIFFERMELFPEVIRETEHPTSIYICPLCFSDRSYGSIILQYWQPDGYDMTFLNWIRSAAQGLEFLRMKNDISYLLECQNLSLYHDTVTNLYNESGYIHAVKTYCSQTEPEQQLYVYLLRTNLFDDTLNLDCQKQKLDMQQNISGVLRRLCSNEICGRVEENTFVFAVSCEHTTQSIAQIQARLELLLTHVPAYFSICGMDSFVIAAQQITAQELLSQAEEQLKTLQQQLSVQIQGLLQKRQNPFYAKLLPFRNAMYAQPNDVKTVQDLCRQFSVSEGYFRSLYKECFDVSYHQDCILSRVSLAQYLLTTTAMSITYIAEKCGYEDEKYFMRQFQKTIGISAGQYRMQFSSGL